MKKQEGVGKARRGKGLRTEGGGLGLLRYREDWLAGKALPWPPQPCACPPSLSGSLCSTKRILKPARSSLGR